MNRSRILSAVAGCFLIVGMTMPADAQMRVTKIQFNDDVSTFTYNAAGTLTGAVRKDPSSTYKFTFSFPSADKVVKTSQLTIYDMVDTETSNFTLFPGQQKLTQNDSDGKFWMFDKNGYSLNGVTREKYVWKGNNISKVRSEGANGWWEEINFKYNGMSYKPCSYTINWVDFLLSYYEDMPAFDWEWWQCSFWPFSELPKEIEHKSSSNNNFTLVFDYFFTPTSGKPSFTVEIKTDINGKMVERNKAILYFE